MIKILAFEGISGAGKSFYLSLLKKTFKGNPRVVFLDELELKTDEKSDYLGDGLACDLKKLYERNRFFSIGRPLEETTLISANYIIKLLQVKSSVIQDAVLVVDRGSETIAIYQDIICQRKMANTEGYCDDIVYSFLNSLFLKLKCISDVIVYFSGNAETQISRAESREGKIYTEGEKEILKLADSAYRRHAKTDSRYLMIDIDDPVNINIEKLSAIIEEILQT